jgi:LmbE family N-acetylglucosaminyl deacetylase
MKQSLLTVFAHPDDAETAVGGSLLLWAAEGWDITLCIITDGDKGTNDPADSREAVIARRRAEQTAAAARLGASVIYLGYEDGVLQPTLDLRRDLVRVLRRVRPHRVVANDPTVWFRHGLYINHPDHRAAGQALVEAVYPAVKKPGIFPELLAEGLQPHVVEEVWLAAADEADTWIDISSVLEAKIELICDHTSQFSPEPTKVAFSRIAAAAGKPRGLAAAEAYRTLRLAANTVRALAGQ